MKQKIGYIISGSLNEGLIMRIESPQEKLETIKTGKFVCIAGNNYSFFSLITDLQLAVTHPEILLYPPESTNFLLTQIIKKQYMYVTARLKPMLMLTTQGEKLPIKTIPSHFVTVYEATTKDVAAIFGSERHEPKKYFSIGTPLDMSTPVCLNLEQFTERSNGIFGKTGTGKTFITRLLLAGLIKNDKAINLIFDMHSEYGLQARQEDAHFSFVKGLKTLFPSKVAIFSLDPSSTRRRGSTPDIEITIPYQAVHVEDILSLQDELNLHATAFEAAHLLATRYKSEWLYILLTHGHDIKELAQEIGAHPESLAALYRKLKRIERLPFFVSKNKNSNACSVIDQMIEYIDKGISIIVEFGNFTSTFCYLFIANIITRRIHTEYIKKTEFFLGSQKTELEPKKLLITIEEAHKFLQPHLAKQTIFGTIAREMRKYYVSLLIVDQRPSNIDQEILSQIGTKIVAQLHDEKDITSVLSGIHHASHLRTILASLDSKKQVLVLGHAIAMPVVIQTREYNETFYRDIQQVCTQDQISETINELFI